MEIYNMDESKRTHRSRIERKHLKEIQELVYGILVDKVSCETPKESILKCSKSSQILSGKFVRVGFVFKKRTEHQNLLFTNTGSNDDHDHKSLSVFGEKLVVYFHPIEAGSPKGMTKILKAMNDCSQSVDKTVKISNYFQSGIVSNLPTVASTSTSDLSTMPHSSGESCESSQTSVTDEKRNVIRNIIQRSGTALSKKRRKKNDNSVKSDVKKTKDDIPCDKRAGDVGQGYSKSPLVTDPPDIMNRESYTASYRTDLQIPGDGIGVKITDISRTAENVDPANLLECDDKALSNVSNDSPKILADQPSLSPSSTTSNNCLSLQEQNTQLRLNGIIIIGVDQLDDIKNEDVLSEMSVNSLHKTSYRNDVKVVPVVTHIVNYERNVEESQEECYQSYSEDNIVRTNQLIDMDRRHQDDEDNTVALTHDNSSDCKKVETKERIKSNSRASIDLFSDSDLMESSFHQEDKKLSPQSPVHNFYSSDNYESPNFGKTKHVSIQHRSDRYIEDDDITIVEETEASHRRNRNKDKDFINRRGKCVDSKNKIGKKNEQGVSSDLQKAVDTNKTSVKSSNGSNKNCVKKQIESREMSEKSSMHSKKCNLEKQNIDSFKISQRRSKGSSHEKTCDISLRSPKDDDTCLHEKEQVDSEKRQQCGRDKDNDRSSEDKNSSVKSYHENKPGDHVNSQCEGEDKKVDCKYKYVTDEKADSNYKSGKNAKKDPSCRFEKRKEFCSKDRSSKCKNSNITFDKKVLFGSDSEDSDTNVSTKYSNSPKQKTSPITSAIIQKGRRPRVRRILPDFPPEKDEVYNKVSLTKKNTSKTQSNSKRTLSKLDICRENIGPPSKIRKITENDTGLTNSQSGLPATEMGAFVPNSLDQSNCKGGRPQKSVSAKKHCSPIKSFKVHQSKSDDSCLTDPLVIEDRSEQSKSGNHANFDKENEVISENNLDCIVLEHLSTDVQQIKSHDVMEDKIKDVKNVDELNEEQLSYLVTYNTTYIKDIFEGKIPCERHDVYKMGGKLRKDLNHHVHLGLYKDAQIDVVMEKLIAIFCKKHSKVLDYIMKVLLPEMLIKIYMDVHNISHDETEERMQNALNQPGAIYH